jgi:sporulation integral membrane protein YtvI
MLAFYRKYWRTALDIGLIVLTVYLVMFVFSYLYRIAAPIFLALVIFWMIEPLARFLHKRKIKKSIATAIAMLVYLLVLLSLLAGASALFIYQANRLIGNLPQYATVFYNTFSVQIDWLISRVDLLPPDLLADAGQYLKEFGGTIAQKGSNVAVWLFLWLTGFVGSVSNFVIDLVIAVILAYFLSVEIDTWKRVAREKTPNTFKKAYAFLRDNVLKGLASYIKAQLKLITLTFFLVLIGLLILRVENFFAISVVSAIFDVLPLLGVSTIFVPWIIFLFVTGKTGLAVGLTVLWLIVLLTRQILEPKITGQSLGVSAFTTLAFMVVSLSLFGVMGLILSPVLIILVKALYDQGYLRKWIRLPADEFEPEPAEAASDAAGRDKL